MRFLQATIGLLCVILAPFVSSDSPESSNGELYKVNPGDTLSITIRNEDTLNRPEILVRPDGYISIPIIGDVAAGGQTIPEIESGISKDLAKYLRDEPVVTASLIGLNGNAIYVLGKVNRPGQFVIRTETDVTQALALAGGITTFADNNSIKILRRDSKGVQHAIAFNYSAVKKGKKLNSNILLKSGDVVLVP